jgi:hypothetical protein
MKRHEAAWPPQRAPEGFAERVVRAALAERRRPRVPRKVVVGLAIAATFSTGVAVGFRMNARPRSGIVSNEAAMVTKRELEANAEVERLRAEVDQLRMELALNASEHTRAEKLKSHLIAKPAKAGVEKAAEQRTPQKSCNCQAGDPLCSCK